MNRSIRRGVSIMSRRRQHNMRSFKGYLGRKPDAEALQELLDMYVPSIMEYLEAADAPVKEGLGTFSSKVTTGKSPTELASLLDLELPDKSTMTAPAIKKSVKDVLRYSVLTSSPRYHDKLYAGAEPVGMFGELLAAVTNTNIHTFASAPVFIHMELALLKRLREIIGFPETGDGIMTPGGSYANLLAMYVARERACPGTMMKGILANDQPARLAAFTSTQAHYSIDRAAALLGIGRDSVFKVETDARGAMKPAALDAALEAAVKDGFTPFFINATAGTTVTGAFDPLEDLAKVADEWNLKVYGLVQPEHDPQRPVLWLHVDGAWGGSAVFVDDQQRPDIAGLLKGLPEVDSFVLNPHKMLGVPLQCSALLLKHPTLLRDVCASNADYLFHGDGSNDVNDYDVGDKTMQCGRKPDALKFFLSWKYLGRKGFGDRVTNAFDMAAKLSDMITHDEAFHLVAPVTSTNVCFWYLPEKDGLRSSFRKKMDERSAALASDEVEVNDETSMHSLSECVKELDTDIGDVTKTIQR